MQLSNSATAPPAYVLDQLALDYRAEVLAAGLLAGDAATAAVPLGQLIFQPIGPITRPYAKDAAPPQLLAADGAPQPYHLLATPREGLYDQLPPFLFHPVPPTAGSLPATETTLEQLRQARLVEQETRRFFLPFDTELYYLRLLRYQRERQHDQLANAPGLLRQFAEGWPILRRLDPAKASLFIQLLPFIHQLRGDLPWLRQLLAILLEVPVRIETEQPVPPQAATEPTLALGQCRLGINALAGSTFSDGYNAVHVHLGPVPAGRVAEFLPESPARALVQEVLDYFMPATVETHLFVAIERAAPAAQAPAAPLAAYLGYNSYL